MHPVGWPWDVVGKVRGVNWGEGPGVYQEEIGLLLGAIKPNSDEDTIILASAISRGEYQKLYKIAALIKTHLVLVENAFPPCSGWVDKTPKKDVNNI